jgi:hypothetical protein
MYTGKSFLSEFNTLQFSRQILENYSEINLHENSSNGSRVVPRGRTDIYYKPLSERRMQVLARLGEMTNEYKNLVGNLKK